MSALELLNNRQRKDMIDRGMNPLNESHVKSYLSGRGLSQNQLQKEVEEKMRLLMGGKLEVDLGGRSDRDVTPQVGQEFSGKAIQSYNEDPRSAIAASMDDYVNTNNMGTTSNGSGGSGFADLYESEMPQQSSMNQQTLMNNGSKLATDYYNAFIRSLKEPSTQSNLEVYRALEKMLKYESSIKKQHGGQAQKILVEGVNNVTKQMYQKLKG